MNYIEVTLQPTVDIPINFLWGKVFSRIHLRLVSQQDENGTVPLGLSFPEYSENPPGLGTKSRIFAMNEHVLEEFNVNDCLKIFSGYLHISGIRAAPEKATYAVYRRIQPQASAQRLARRKAQREGSTYEQALEKLQGLVKQQVSLPYIQMKSSSSGKSFSFFIKKEICEISEHFLFNTYGLSKGGTVPEF